MDGSARLTPPDPVRDDLDLSVEQQVHGRQQFRVDVPAQVGGGARVVSVLLPREVRDQDLQVPGDVLRQDGGVVRGPLVRRPDRVSGRGADHIEVISVGTKAITHFRSYQFIYG